MKLICRFLATVRAERNERQATTTARQLRNHIRTEQERIFNLRNRARGLRLYAAWRNKRTAQPTGQGLSALIPGAETITKETLTLVRKAA